MVNLLGFEICLHSWRQPDKMHLSPLSLPADAAMMVFPGEPNNEQLRQ